MPYCQNCGREMHGNFCQNCGAPSGEINFQNNSRYDYDEPIIRNDVEVHPLYKPGHMVLAGWLGIYGIVITLASIVLCLGMFIGIGAQDLDTTGSGEMLAGWVIGCIIALAIGIGLTLLCYLPGIRSIRKYSPEGEAGKNIAAFIGKSLLFIFLWGVVLAGCVYIVGIFFKIWRLGMWVTCPRDDQYVAVVNGRNVPVGRYIDDLPYGYGQSKYCYMDADGVFYRPTNP